MIFLTGASGFVGGHLLDFLVGKGREVKCLARSDKSAEKLARKGAAVVRGDITRPETLKDVLHKEDFVVHLVGIIEEKGKSTFRSVHVEGTANLVAEAKRAGIMHFFYQSALGADKGSWSGYLKTKAEAEDIVKNSGLAYSIFRPSLIIGPWDGFTSKLVDMIKLSPVLPIPGEGKSKFQPVSVHDWIKCMAKVIESPGQYKSTFDIGGPEHITYREMVETLAEVMGRSKPVVTLPMGFMKVSTILIEKIFSSPPVTSDQLKLLEMDNITDLDVIEKNFEFKPVTYKDTLKDFVKPKA